MFQSLWHLNQSKFKNSLHAFHQPLIYNIPIHSQDYKVAEISRLIDVYWLIVEGKYDMSKLTVGVKYEFVFVLMMQEPVAGWTNTPVTFTLDLPNGTSQGHRMTLSYLPKNE